MKIFYPIKQFYLTIPIDFNHETYVSKFLKNKQKLSEKYQIDLEDNYFLKSRECLLPGKRYLVKIFSIKSQVLLHQCLDFLKFQKVINKGIITGSIGLMLAHDLCEEYFPVGEYSFEYTISPDEKEFLFKTKDGFHIIPRFGAMNGGVEKSNWYLDYGYFEYSLENYSVSYNILSFYNEG